MDMKIEVRTEYLYVKFSGAYDFKSGLAQFKQVAAACAQHNLSRVLMDATGLIGEVSIIDRHDLGVELAAQKIIARAAMIARPDQLLPDRFMQNVAKNRGL